MHTYAVLKYEGNKVHIVLHLLYSTLSSTCLFHQSLKT